MGPIRKFKNDETIFIGYILTITIFLNRSIEACSLYCLKYAALCSAFEFSNQICYVSNKPTFIKYYKYTKRKSIWINPSKTSVSLTTCKRKKLILLNFIF